MSIKCEICGKGAIRGRTITYRGKAKKEGGIGKKITGITKRTFKPNLQNVRAVINNKVKRITVCTECIRNEKVRKPG